MVERGWMVEARRWLGTREVPGAGSSAAIMAWAKRLGLAYAGDSTAWCGLFVAHCLRAALPGETLPALPLVARAWTRFGVACTPQPGAVLVFWRGSRKGWSGHVGFYAGEDDGAYLVLGGNQGDRVSLAWLEKARLLTARWPVTDKEGTAEAGTGASVQMVRQGQLSVNEA